jgi:hypothetical protein
MICCKEEGRRWMEDGQVLQHRPRVDGYELENNVSTSEREERARGWDGKTYTHGCGLGKIFLKAREVMRVLEVEIFEAIEFAGAWFGAAFW